MKKTDLKNWQDHPTKGANDFKGIESAFEDNHDNRTLIICVIVLIIIFGLIWMIG